MHAVLMTTALVLGSGDARGGVTDGRTVEQVSPYSRLRKGMSKEQVAHLCGIGDCSSAGGNDVWAYDNLVDVLGRRQFACVYFSDGKVTNWSIFYPSP